MRTTNYAVTGLDRGHGVAAVTSRIGMLAGVRAVSVDFTGASSAQVRVVGDVSVPAEHVRAAVREAGYITEQPPTDRLAS